MESVPFRSVPFRSVPFVQYRQFTSTINLKNFTDPPYQFGMEATVPLEGVRRFTTISRNDLVYYLYHTANAADPEALKRTKFNQMAVQILTEILGSYEKYSVQECLNKLRKIENPTAKHKLLMRTLALISFDLLDPIDVEQQDIRKIYDDLHILEPEIMPEPRAGGANIVNKLRLYQDGERQIRLHIYPPGKKEDDFIAKDNLPHQHFGSSASVILAGTLVNQHFLSTKTNDPHSEYMLYKIKTNYNLTRNPAQAIRCGKKLIYLHGVDLSLVSSHTYKSGDYYHLPKPISKRDGKAFPYALQDSDRLSYHNVGTQGITATLWGLRYSNNANSTLSTVLRSEANEPEVDVSYASRNVAKNNFFKLLPQADRQIRQELEQPKKITTMLDRGYRGLFQSRAKFYLRNEIKPQIDSVENKI